jgi:predicted DCC family thiol-disulfide oxidoreductase YuxK
MRLQDSEFNEHPVLVFDGVCNLCEWLVVFVVKRDRRGKIRFVAAQSDIGQQLQEQYGADAIRDSTMILLKNGQVYCKSDAAIAIAKELDGLWKLLVVFAAIPKSLRDWIYAWIGENRYKWFGRKSQCLIPSADLKSRFLEY